MLETLSKSGADPTLIVMVALTILIIAALLTGFRFGVVSLLKAFKEARDDNANLLARLHTDNAKAHQERDERIETMAKLSETLHRDDVQILRGLHGEGTALLRDVITALADIRTAAQNSTSAIQELRGAVTTTSQVNMSLERTVEAQGRALSDLRNIVVEIRGLPADTRPGLPFHGDASLGSTPKSIQT